MDHPDLIVCSFIKNSIRLKKGLSGGAIFSRGGGPTFSRGGGGGSKMLISIETYRTCDFLGVFRTPYSYSRSRHVLLLFFSTISAILMHTCSSINY